MGRKKTQEYVYPKIRYAMLVNEDTMENLAKILGVSKYTLSHKMNGKTEWTISEIEKLCIYYEKDYYDLFK